MMVRRLWRWCVFLLAGLACGQEEQHEHHLSAVPALTFQIHRPAHGATVGQSLFFDVHLYARPPAGTAAGGSDAATVPSAAVNVALRVTSQAVGLDTTVALTSQSFSCIFTDIYVAPGWNTYTVQLLTNGTFSTVLHTEELRFFSQRVADGQPLGQVVSMMQAKPHQHFAYLLLRAAASSPAGTLDRHLDWTYFLPLDGRRVEIVTLGGGGRTPNATQTTNGASDNDNDNDDDDVRSLCRAFWSASFSSHCFRDLAALRNVVFVDTAFVSFAALLHHAAPEFLHAAITTCTSTGSGGGGGAGAGVCAVDLDPSLLARLEVLLLDVVQRSREAVWLFVPAPPTPDTPHSDAHAAAAAAAAAHAASAAFFAVKARLDARRLVFKDARFEPGDGGAAVGADGRTDVVVQGLTAWVLLLAPDADALQAAQHWPLAARQAAAARGGWFWADAAVRASSADAVGATDDAGGAAPSLPDHSADAPNDAVASRLVFSSTDVGRAFLLLENACVSPDHVVFLFKPRNDDPVIVDVPALAAHEDLGFLYTGMRFVELATAGGPDAPQAQHIFGRWPWVAGLSALSLSVSPGHLQHEQETLVQLLHAATAVAAAGIDPDTLRTPSEAWPRLWKYAYVARRLARVFVGKLHSGTANEWVVAFIGCIFGHWYDAFNNAAPTPAGAGRLPWVAPPAVHFQEHYFAAMYGQRPAAWVSLEQQQARQGEAGIKHEAVPTTFSLDHGVCFSELLVLGRANSHVTFIGDAALSEAFKARVYAQVDADEDVDVNVRINAASPRFNTSAALAGAVPALPTAMRARRLKVVVALRGGPLRMITNFDAVQSALLGSGVVDGPWLLRHVVVMETLSFKSQVGLMRAADVFIAVHGAAVTNGMFMRPGSAVIDIYNGRYLEFYFAPVLRESGVELLHVVVYNQSDGPSHCSPYPPRCLHGEVTDGADLYCLGLRQCSIAVRIDSFRAALAQAHSYVLANKWLHDS